MHVTSEKWVFWVAWVAWAGAWRPGQPFPADAGRGRAARQSHMVRALASTSKSSNILNKSRSFHVEKGQDGGVSECAVAR
jgi:hypothetical protein